jgi:hypothetical protein
MLLQHVAAPRLPLMDFSLAETRTAALTRLPAREHMTKNAESDA